MHLQVTLKSWYLDMIITFLVSYSRLSLFDADDYAILNHH